MPPTKALLVFFSEQYFTSKNSPRHKPRRVFLAERYIILSKKAKTQRTLLLLVLLLLLVVLPLFGLTFHALVDEYSVDDTWKSNCPLNLLTPWDFSRTVSSPFFNKIRSLNHPVRWKIPARLTYAFFAPCSNLPADFIRQSCDFRHFF